MNISLKVVSFFYFFLLLIITNKYVDCEKNAATLANIESQIDEMRARINSDHALLNFGIATLKEKIVDEFSIIFRELIALKSKVEDVLKTKNDMQRRMVINCEVVTPDSTNSQPQIKTNAWTPLDEQIINAQKRKQKPCK